MLRPATHDQLLRLQAAACASDVELDAALVSLGVLPPLDLGPIRSCLQPGRELDAATNRDGHRVIVVRDQGMPVAWIHPDGSVAAGPHSLVA